MKTIVKNGLLILAAAIIGATTGVIYRSCQNNKVCSLKIENTIELEDSVKEQQRQIDTVYIKLNDLNRDYKKVIDTVVNNDPSADVVFFLEYIGSNKERLDSMYLSK